jgi:hypothetical protein
MLACLDMTAVDMQLIFEYKHMSLLDFKALNIIYRDVPNSECTGEHVIVSAIRKYLVSFVPMFASSYFPRSPLAIMVPLISPNIDRQHVSAYNSNGKALVDLLDSTNISPQHDPLILGLFAVYTTLISLQYISPDDISWAPHSEFFDGEWLAVGFTQDVVAILALLPYPRRKLSGWDIAPEAPAQSYLGKGKGSVRDTTFNQDDNILPEHIRITNGGRNGNNYIYNTKDGKLSLNNISLRIYPFQVQCALRTCTLTCQGLRIPA